MCWVQTKMIQYIKKKKINIRRKRGSKCRSKVLEVRGKGIQDMSAEAGHRRKQGQFIPCDRAGRHRTWGYR